MSATEIRSPFQLLKFRERLTPSPPAELPQSPLSPAETERLAGVVARTIALAGRNRYAASLVIDMTETVLKYFDA